MQIYRKRSADGLAGAAPEVAKGKPAVAGKRQAGMPPPSKAARLDFTSLANIKGPGRSAAAKPRTIVRPFMEHALSFKRIILDVQAKICS